MFEAVGKHSVGDMSDEDLDELEQVACPSAGACGAQFTANTMATVSEAIGLALPYSAGAPAPYEIRDRFCMAAGEQVMDLVRMNLRPRDIVTRKALENAAATGCGLGRLDQCGAAPAGDRARVRHRVRPVRRRRGLQKDTVYRRSETGRPLCRQRHVRGWRHTAADEDAARPRLPARRLHDRHRPHHRREPEVREVESGPGRRPSRRQADHRHRRRRRPQGQSRSGRRDREGRRHVDPEVHRPGALLRRRGGLLRGGRRRAPTRKATSSSSATRGRAAAPACARCCRPPRRCTGRARAARSR